MHHDLTIYCRFRRKGFDPFFGYQDPKRPDFASKTSGRLKFSILSRNFGVAKMKSIDLIAGAASLLLLYGATATADEHLSTKAWEENYQRCTSGCKDDFYFSEQTTAPFAALRSACVEGCAAITTETLPGYKRCYTYCKKTFPYRHGMPESFAGFQEACILGCGEISVDNPE